MNQSAVSVRVGFVPTFRFRYGDWCRTMHEQSVAMLSKINGLELVQLPGSPGTDPSETTPNGAVHTLDEAEAAVRAFRAAEVDGLIICPLDFGDERSTAKVAEQLGVPTLLFATKEPPASTDMSLARVSDSYCGTLSIASALYRRTLPYRFAGIFFPDDPGLAREAQDFTRALAVVAGLRNARVGQVGSRPAPFETVGYSETALIRKFGQNVIYRDLADILARANEYEAGDPTLKQLADDLMGSVAEATVPPDYADKAARVQTALTEFWREHTLSVMAVQCWPTLSRRGGIEPCAVYGQLTERGMLTACEADVLGALSMLCSHRAALGATVPHFIDWTIKHREHDNRFLAWHCGNAPTCLAADPSRVALRQRRDMTGEGDSETGRGGLFQFQVKPGMVTLCRLAEYDNQWKMLIARGEIVPSDETLAGTWSWVEVSDHDKLYRTLAEQGFIHHASMIHGDQCAALETACGLMGIEVVRGTE